MESIQGPRAGLNDVIDITAIEVHPRDARVRSLTQRNIEMIEGEELCVFRIYEWYT